MTEMRPRSSLRHAPAAADDRPACVLVGMDRSWGPVDVLAGIEDVIEFGGCRPPGVTGLLRPVIPAPDFEHLGALAHPSRSQFGHTFGSIPAPGGAVLHTAEVSRFRSEVKRCGQPRS